jgi:hypothetical protein
MSKFDKLNSLKYLLRLEYYKKSQINKKIFFLNKFSFILYSTKVIQNIIFK